MWAEQRREAMSGHGLVVLGDDHGRGWRRVREPRRRGLSSSRFVRASR